MNPVNTPASESTHVPAVPRPQDADYVAPAFAAELNPSTTTSPGYLVTTTEIIEAPVLAVAPVTASEIAEAPRLSVAPSAADSHTVPESTPQGTSYIDTVKSGVAYASSAATTAAQNVSAAITNSGVVPKAQALASNAASATYGAAQSAYGAVASSNIVPKAQEAASNAAGTASSTISSGATAARDLISNATVPAATSSFTTPASAAAPAAHYEAANLTVPGISVPHTTSSISTPIEYVETPALTGGTPTLASRAGDAVGSVAGAIGGALTSATTTARSVVTPADSNTTSSTSAPTLAARAGDVAGSVAGAVGGTLTTAATMAKTAVFGETPAQTREVGVMEKETEPDILLRAGSTAGSVAGSVAGTLATVATAAKDAVVSGVTSVTGYGSTTTPAAVSRSLPLDESTPYDEGNLLDIKDETVASAPQATVGQTASNILGKTVEAAGAAAGFATGTATKARDTVADVASTTYNSTAATATSARDVVTSHPAYNTLSTKAAAAKDAVVGTTTSTYHSAADSAALYTAGSRLKPVTSTSYELVESDIPNPLTDVRSSAPVGLGGEEEHTQRALAPAVSTPGRPNETASYLAGESLGLPSAATGETGLMTEAAINAVSLPADHRTAEQQNLVDHVLAGRDLTSVGQPNTEFGSAAPISSALPADDLNSYNDAPSDNSSTRSLAPASAGSRRSMTEDEIYESSHQFKADASVPSHVIPPVQAAHSPATSVIPEEDDSNNIDQDGKPKKLHGLFDKAMGKLSTGVGKVLHKDSLVETGQARHAAGAAEIDRARTLAK